MTMFARKLKSNRKFLAQKVFSSVAIATCGALIFGSTSAVAAIPVDQNPGYEIKNQVVVKGAPQGGKVENPNSLAVSFTRALASGYINNATLELAVNQFPKDYQYKKGSGIDPATIYAAEPGSKNRKRVSRTIADPAGFCKKYGSSRCVFISGALLEKYPYIASSNTSNGGNLSYRVDESESKSEANQNGWSAGGKIDISKIGANFTYSASTTRTTNITKTRSTNVSHNIPNNTFGRVDEYFNGGNYAGVMLISTQALPSYGTLMNGTIYCFMGWSGCSGADGIPIKYKYIAIPMEVNVISDTSSSATTSILRTWKPGSPAPKP